MPIVWPASLPQQPQLGWSEEKVSNTIRSESDTGAAKLRRRFTAATWVLSLPFFLTEAQVATLEAFHGSTLADGVLRFDFAHPRTGVTESMRFRGPLSISEPAKGFYRATLELEFIE